MADPCASILRSRRCLCLPPASFERPVSDRPNRMARSGRPLCHPWTTRATFQSPLCLQRRPGRFCDRTREAPRSYPLCKGGIRNCHAKTFHEALNEPIHYKSMWVGQLRGRIGLDSFESHWLKRPSGLDSVEFRLCHAIFHVKYCNALWGSLEKGTNELILHGLRVSHKGPLARSWSGHDRGLLAIAKGLPHTPGRPILAEDARCALIGFCQVPG